MQRPPSGAAFFDAMAYFLSAAPNAPGTGWRSCTIVPKSRDKLGITGSIETSTGLAGAELEFNPEITLLVGINGSGKTSVLNVINWLLKPDLERLALAHFDSLILNFSENNLNYKLSAERTRQKVTLAIEGPKKGASAYDGRPEGVRPRGRGRDRWSLCGPTSREA
jgi:hypothetical protein